MSTFSAMTASANGSTAGAWVWAGRGAGPLIVHDAARTRSPGLTIGRACKNTIQAVCIVMPAAPTGWTAASPATTVRSELCCQL